MPLEPEGRIRSAIEQMILLVGEPQCEAVAQEIASLQREVAAAICCVPNEMIRRATRLHTALTVAGQDLEVGDVQGALLSLERALAIVTKADAR